MKSLVIRRDEKVNKSVKLNLSLQTKILILIFLVIFLSLGIAGYLITDYVSVEMEKQIAQQALVIAHAVSEIPEVKEYVGQKDGHLVINPLVEEIRKKSKAEFIVVIDMNSTRYSHPVSERIGQKFVGGDEGDVLQGKEYTSRAVGTLGPSLRGLVPVFRGDAQVGAVVVGVLTTDVQKSIKLLQNKIERALVLGLLIGFIGAIILARNVKKAMFGLEPIEIATLLEEKQAILSSIREGIIAINKKGLITMLNERARSLLGLNEESTGLPIVDVVPNTRLPHVIKTGKAEFDQDQMFYEHRVLTNRVPITLNNEVVGAVASFRDMTEIQNLAEELTGVRKYAEALRAQSHEYKNKIHTIAGLLQLGQYTKAVDFIMDAHEKHQDTVDFLIRKIKDPLIAGLLLGKQAVAHERAINLVFDENCSLNSITARSSSHQLITVLGNLIDNAFEAVRDMDVPRRQVRVLIRENDAQIEIEVEDWGRGIEDGIAERIYEQGFTTKGKENKGIGLTLVRNFVREKDGHVFWYNIPEGGVIFSIILPKERLEK